MSMSRTFAAFALSGAVVVAPPKLAHATPPPPSGAHPRLFLGPSALAAAKEKAKVGTSGAARAIALCKRVVADPASFKNSGYQGDNWAFPLSSCALAWQLTKEPAYAAAGVKLWKAILSDVQTMGDKGACVPGASESQAIAAVRRDTGYAIRFIGSHTALAYDWLNDAPGVDEALRAQSRACFKAWIGWYTKTGYLNDMPGSNYHAGFVAAKALIAVAEAREDGATSDKMWAETVDDIFGKQIVGKGLAKSGALVGGDWAEGWQYGTLAVVHYALATRALEEHGVALPAMHTWASALTKRFVHGLLPSRDAMYVGGDTSAETLYLPPYGRILAAATIIAPSSDEVAGWASFLRENVAKEKDTQAPVFDAIAETRSAAPIDPYKSSLPFWYLARGTGNLYVRSSFAPGAVFAVFTSGARVVADHQHADASNFVLSRGADHLVVDPSPYGSRSSLTGNALTVDSLIAAKEYRPSQTPWSKAEMPWMRATKSGIVAARSDFARAYDFSQTASDVPFARRDWVFVPEGEVITIDRTRTDAAARLTHLRFRTLAKLALAGKIATGKVGASKVAIHQVKLSAGSAAIKSYPAVDDCEGGPFGACTHARVPVDEYAIDIPGPRALAIHVIDALAAGDAPADVKSLNELDAPMQNDGVIGAAVRRGKSLTLVVASAAKDGAPGTKMTYASPADVASRHVVFDAPEDASGRSIVKAVAVGGRCVITIRPGAGFSGRPLMFDLSSAADGCKATEHPEAPAE